MVIRLRTRCCERTPLGRCHVGRSSRVKWHKRWCMHRQMTASIPHPFPTIIAVSFSLFSFFPIHPALSLRPICFQLPSRFPPLHLPSTVVDPWVFWPLGTISNLETRHGVPYRRLYVVVETIEREEVSLLSLSLSDQDANKSSQTNIKWQRESRRIYTIFSKVRTLREMIDATHFHA